MTNQASPSRSQSAQVIQYQGRIYVFSSMLVNRLGKTPRRLIAQFETDSLPPEELGRSVRSAIADSLAWVEFEEFEKSYSSEAEPVSRALGVRNKDLGKAERSSGRVTVADWSDASAFVVTPWLSKRTSGSPIKTDDAPLPKDCSDKDLGLRVISSLTKSLGQTVEANRR